MKECRECEFFEGYDYSDGTPCCTCEGGCECCPFNDIGDVKNKGMKIEINTGFMHDYILHTMKNTIERNAVSVANNEVEKLITEELKTQVTTEIKRQVENTVSKAITEFMSKEITIGGGWREPERMLTREQYLAETIEKELESRFKSDVIKSYAENEVKKAINNYDTKLRDEINKGIKTYFDTATREVLTQNVVSMLMCNDTYKKLSDSMNAFLPSKPEGRR